MTVAGLAAQALMSAQLGDSEPALELAASWASSNEAEQRAWSRALLAWAWLCGAYAEPPRIDDLQARMREPREVRRALVRVVGVAARGRVLELDGSGLGRATALHAELSHDLSDPVARIEQALLALWCQTADDAGERVEAARRLEREAASAELPSETTEAAVLRALAELDAGNSDGALETARRAARMARTEALPLPEHLAAIVLARVRRHGERAHMATRITSALSSYVARPWSGLVAWERTLASGLGPSPADADPRHPSALLAAWIGAAQAGDRETFQRLGAELESRVSFAPARRDFERAFAAIDPLRSDAGLPDIARFRNAESTELPLGMSGLAAAGAEPGEAIARVAIAPQWERGVRIVPTGARLIEPLAGVDGRPARQPRTQALVAVLALAGKRGLSETEAFTQAYGFGFNPELHRDAFNVTVHRARAHVESFAELERANSRMRLTVQRAKALHDPRCMQPLTDRVLRSVAATGIARAKEIAHDVGISLRSAQNALEALVDEGGCERRKHGRTVEYVLEDTTFQVPTRHRQKSQ